MQTLNSSSIITRYKNTNKTFYFKFSDLEIQTVPMTDYINILFNINYRTGNDVDVSRFIKITSYEDFSFLKNNKKEITKGVVSSFSQGENNTLIAKTANKTRNNSLDPRQQKLKTWPKNS